VREPLTFKPVTDDDRADFFAKYTNASIGKVKNLYLKWARLKGAFSPECQQLNRLFSQCVDGNRIKVPPALEDPPEEQEASVPFILDILHGTSEDAINAAQDKDPSYMGYPVDAIDLLLSRDQVAISEFELLQLTLQWCDRNEADIRDFVQFFDFSLLNDEEQMWLLSRIPPTQGIPSLVRNGLLQSQLVEPAELSRFKLDHPGLHWKRVFSSSVDRMGRFLNTVCHSLELFHKKLIILQADERLTLAIYIPQKIAKSSEVQVDASVRVFALPRSQGYQSAGYRVMPTKHNYRLYCDDLVFQLYELKRGNTFIFLTRGPSDEASFRNLKSQGDKRRQKQLTIEDGTNFDCRVSVALQKISKGIQSHVGRMNRAGIQAAVSIPIP
jgi:RNA dependent RNA polymerase